MSTKQKIPYDPFKKDAEFDKRVKETMKDVISSATGAFKQLDPKMSMFFILPRTEAENPMDFFVPAYMHHGLKESGDDGKKRDTARLCLEAAGLGPCAICDTIRMLSGSKSPDDKKIAQRLTPRKKIYFNVWWIPLQAQVGAVEPGPTVFQLADFEGKPRAYVVSDDPELGLLGLPKGAWEDLQVKVQTSGGIARFMGEDAWPLYVIGNGKERLARRYKEPSPLLNPISPDLRPPEGLELLNITETVEFPTPAGVAGLVEENLPGLITDFSLYPESLEGEAVEEVEEQEEAPASTDGFGKKE